MIYAFIQKGSLKIFFRRYENPLTKASRLNVILSLKYYKDVSPAFTSLHCFLRSFIEIFSIN